jgi:hypothetical protein
MPLALSRVRDLLGVLILFESLWGAACDLNPETSCLAVHDADR